MGRIIVDFVAELRLHLQYLQYNRKKEISREIKTSLSQRYIDRWESAVCTA